MQHLAAFSKSSLKPLRCKCHKDVAEKVLKLNYTINFTHLLTVLRLLIEAWLFLNFHYILAAAKYPCV